MTRNGMRPIHPGEILREEYLSPLEMSVNVLSMALHVPATRMNEIVRENRGITADTALRLARYFGTSDRFWLNLQTEYELRRAQISKAEQGGPGTSRLSEAGCQ
ncbi:addiction module antidote protein, HigA family [Marinobacter sp. LV10R510-11A]|uniref:HigA family addiction module antitoxin n=1 Tax=Marinobacter sp. LV10R510-11A TaxID=1415568 RepID=UPI000BC0CB27|nr:HigA family addiction module antitoxin [Marinobacter sp. LV10R510-11A]SOB74762.1 addiction module antidote protein, HigA family [Marinobacter sp. LV10R510-11A]